MGNNQLPRIRYLHEAASSINLACALAALLFALDLQPAVSALFRMDRVISRYLHLLPDIRVIRVPKDEFTEGYFAFFIPAIGLAVCLWLLLRLFSRRGPIREFLRSVSGIVALVALPVWWLCLMYVGERRYGWNPLTAFQFYEVVLVLVSAILYLSRDWTTPDWAVIVIVVLHYGFWFWQFGPRPFFMGYGGPVGAAVGLCAALTWFFYFRQIRRFERQHRTGQLDP